MHRFKKFSGIRFFGILLTATLLTVGIKPAAAQAPQSRFADINGVKLHYLISGSGEPVLLLHGYAEKPRIK